MSSNISKRIGAIRRIKYYLPCITVNSLAKAMVFPLFDYCSPVWSNFTANHHNHLQVLQNKLARVLLHADIRTPIDKMMEDLNWVKLDCRWNHQLLVFTFKGELHLWALFFKTLCIFSKNKVTSDKVTYGPGQKYSKELKNHSFTSVETAVVRLQ